MARRGRDGSNLLINMMTAAAVLAVVLVAAGSILAVRAAAHRTRIEPATRVASRTATSSAEVSGSAVATISAVAATSAAPVSDPATDQVVPVLMYHHVMPDPDNFIAISPDAFARQMAYLDENGYHPVSIAEFAEFRRSGKRLPEKPVLITFDDGRMNQYTYALPVLEEHGFTATFFVCRKWVEGSSDSFMHAEELRDLAGKGFDVESHTQDHTFLVRSRSEDYEDMKQRLWVQTDGHRRWLEGITGRPVTALAYPGGATDEHTARLAEEAGYLAAFTTKAGLNRWDTPDPYLLHRYNPGARGFTMESFKRMLEAVEAASGADATGDGRPTGEES